MAGRVSSVRRWNRRLHIAECRPKFHRLAISGEDRRNYQLQEEGLAQDERTELVRTSQRSAPFPMRTLQVIRSKKLYTRYCKLLTSGLQKGQSAEMFERTLIFLRKALSDRTVSFLHPYTTKRFYVISGGVLDTNPYNLSNQLHGCQAAIYPCRCATWRAP